ncbi:MAG: cytochrome C oxidase subunit IV family protein [Myxococcales bacterium]|nr:MAG: cytochrome C oxidase subunit IV family protein [Myxococcales bacterium]
MAEHQDHADDHGQGHYVKIWAILLVLLIISILGPILAPHLEFGFLQAWMITIMTAFGIALVKAYLVAANFMHLNIEKKYISYMLGTMLMFMLLFFAGTAPDVMKHEGQNWENRAAEAEVERALKAQEADAHGGEHDDAEH